MFQTENLQEKCTETVQLQYKGKTCSFERQSGSNVWTLPSKDAPHDFRGDQESQEPVTFHLCAEGAHTFARTAKIHSKFRSDLLSSMLDAERILCNMVLFHCTSCNSRFPVSYTHLTLPTIYSV